MGILSLFQSGVNGDDEKSYKRVAVVEDFFRIIYNVHVEMDGRGGKHAGQKRTYRAVSILSYQIILNLCKIHMMEISYSTIW